MFKSLKIFAVYHLVNQAAILTNQTTAIANQGQIIALLNRLTENRDEQLARVTNAVEYLARIEADKRQRAGHPAVQTIQ